MTLSERCWKWIWPAVWVHGAIVFAQDSPPEKVSAEPAKAVVKSVESIPAAIGQVHFQVTSEAVVQGKYWIGLMCVPPDEALRSQLDLPVDVGLLVVEVTDGGPAMKAGIQKHDLLLSIAIVNKSTDAQPLKGLSDLVTQVQAAETSPVKLELLRRGRKQTLELVPVERPTALPAAISGSMSDDEKQILRLWTTPGSHGALGMRWAGPMVVQLPPPSIPPGLSIEFLDAGDKPEKVVVKKGDMTWTVTAADLEKLPDDVRTIVGQQLSARTAARNAGTSLVVHSHAFVVPDDVTIGITRKGAEPAQVNIRKGDKTWQVTENELAKLPDEIRPLAEMALGGRYAAARPPAVGAVRAITVAPQQFGGGGTARIIRHQAGNPFGQGTLVLGGGGGTSAPNERATVRSAETTTRDIERQLKELAEKVENLRQAVEKSQARP